VFLFFFEVCSELDFLFLSIVSDLLNEMMSHHLEISFYIQWSRWKRRNLREVTEDLKCPFNTMSVKRMLQNVLCILLSRDTSGCRESAAGTDTEGWGDQLRCLMHKGNTGSSGPQGLLGEVIFFFSPNCSSLIGFLCPSLYLSSRKKELR